MTLKNLKKRKIIKWKTKIDLKEINDLILKEISSRGNKYRGVSKNGSQWQFLIMKKKILYMVNYNNEEEAARVYDKVMLIYHGLKAKTNFD